MTPSPTQTESALARDPVEELAEAFLERYRQGERPSLSEFTALAPEHAQEILELFPALVLMERAHLGTPASAVKSLVSEPFERLGDYRIIREVGRGGMGIVFEAEQETLGRRVALKVLPASTSGGSNALLRFRREARSAARLHHTNIVPVFDIGEREGVHYYAMQFIQGQGLDEVIAELRWLRDSNGGPPPGAGPPGAPQSESDTASGNPSAVLTDLSSSSTRADGHFYTSAARVGLQAAEALAYAHGQRVLHRDIKPSNLLLDARGGVWVTDFGLAKEEGDDVTRSGSIVGTLRYMAPERFNGVSDVPSDVYGLGLTLYELVTLCPAFPQLDRAQLVRAIVQQEPVAPRRLDPQIPRDLETIVLKAIVKEPAGRYASAEELAEDLRRFLADLPLQTRRVAPWERAGRWCRRNPGWAITVAAVCSLLIVIALGGAILSFQLRRALSDLQVSSTHETEKLWQSHLERARALRSSGRVGQRFQALQAIRDAANIKVTRELSDEAIAALILPDVEIAREWEGCPADTLFVAHDATFEKYAYVNTQGDLTICRFSNPGHDVIARVPADDKDPVKGVWMSPNGRFVALAKRSPQEGGAGRVRVWKLEGNTATLCRDLPEGMSLFSISFHADNRRLAIGHHDGTISVFDLETTGAPQRLTIGAVPLSLAFHPHDDRLAVASNESIRLFDVSNGREVSSLVKEGVKHSSFGLAWHPDGRVLATSSKDLRIHLWDVTNATEVMTPLEGHTGDGIVVAFNHKGDRLISTGWDEQTRLWDAVSGQLLLTMPGRFGAQFSPDDSTIGMQQIGTKLRLWRLADGREFRRIRRPLAEPRETLHSPVLNDDGRVLAAASNNGLVFFDFESGRELSLVPFTNDGAACPRFFDPTSGWLTGGKSGAVLWPAARDPNRPEILRIGPPRRLVSTLNAGVDASLDRRVVAVPRGDHALVLDRDRPDSRIVLKPQYDIRNCAVSPDGRYVATCSWFWNGQFTGVRVWDARTGKHVTDLPVQPGAWGSFSPSGRWLATSSTVQRLQVWDTSNWQRVRDFGGNGACWEGSGQFLAVNEELSRIRLVEPESGVDVLRLTGPEAIFYAPVFITPDGSRLVAVVPTFNLLYVWDLRLIGKQIRDLGLEWNWPEAAPHPNRQKTDPVLAVEVDAGTWAAP